MNMKNVGENFKKESIYLKNLGYDVYKRFQKLNLRESEEFYFSDEDWHLKEDLPFERISIPTFMKICENLLVAKHLHHRATDKTLFELLVSNPSYRYYPRSFYYSNL